MAEGLHQIRNRLVICSLFLQCFFLVGAVSASFAAGLSREEVQSILNDSFVALLTGKEFGPALEQRQDALRDMMERGGIKKAELAAMLEKTVVPVLERHQTSRYILKDLPAKVDRLLAPYMEWNEVEATMWKACSSMIKDGEQIVLKLGTLAPPGTPWLVIPETTLLPKIAKLSGGKVVFKIYGGGVMGEDTDILRKMDIGQLEGCGCTALGILAASPETSAFLIPGLFKNYDEVDYITTKFRKQLDKHFEKRGYILAGMIDTGFFNIYSVNKITGFADLQKQKFLTWFGVIETTLYNELGINPTPVAVPEVVSALSTGLADACLAPSAWMLGMQAYQYIKFYVRQPILYSPAAIVISAQVKERVKKQFGVSERLADNIVELLIYEVGSLETEWRKQIQAYDEKTLKAFEVKCGMKAVDLSPEDRRELEKAGERVRERLAGKAFPEDMMKDILKALDEYRARRPAVSP